MFGIKIKFERKPKVKKEDRKEEEKKEAIKVPLDVAVGRKREAVVSDIFADEKPDLRSIAAEDGVEGEEEPVGPPVLPVGAFQAGRIWEKIAKACLYLLIFLTPLFFLPWGVSPVATNKHFLAMILVLLALISWLAKTIASGKMVWAKTPLNIAAWLLILSWGVSAYFSVSFSKSLGFASVEPTALLNVLTYVLAFFLVGATFGGSRGKEFLSPEQGLTQSGSVEGSITDSLRLRSGNKTSDIQKAIYVFLASLGILAIFTGLKFLNVNFLPWDFAQPIDFNFIGTINALGLFLGFGLVVAVSILVGGGINFLSRHAELGSASLEIPKQVRDDKLNIRRNDKLMRIGLILLSLILGAELLLINFKGIWWAMAGAMLFLVAFVFTREIQKVKEGEEKVIKTQKLILPIIILAISVILLLVNLPISNLIVFPAEVSPSSQATYEIAKDAWKAKGGTAEIGSGPATFSYNYGLYRDRSINQTVFWGIKFNQGSSLLLTSLSTTGIFGFAALILFLAAFVWQSLRSLRGVHQPADSESIPVESEEDLGLLFRQRADRNDRSIPFIATSIFALICWFVYPANFSLMLFAFVFLGLMLAGWKNEREKNAREMSLLVSPQRTLIVSLILIILMVGAVSALYLESQKYIASLYFSSGLNVYNKTGNPDLALEKLAKAVNLDASVDQYWRTASQAFLVKTSNILNSSDWQSAQAAALEDLRSQFQNNMSQAISFAQRAKDADPTESLNWTNLGYVYENVLPFVSGAEKFLVDSYSQAASLEPQNPALRVDLSRAHITIADRFQQQAAQIETSQKPDKAQIDALFAQRNQELEQALKTLEQAVELKPDYSPTHFLMVQVYSRQGALKDALAKSLDYYNLNPKDAGAAFQLGFLLYRDNQIDNAKAAFERAVSLDQNYSNARYFLGLIYDSQGNKQAAKEQFEKIASLNPGNEEITKILDNLNAGRGALETIVPPAPPPEQRAQTPVPEAGGAAKQGLKP